MKDFAHSWFAKFVLCIFGISLSLSLITTVSCYGAIDNIFPSWRDDTTCLGGYTFNCLIGSDYHDSNSEGAMILAVLLFFIVCIYGKFLGFKKLI